jgi:hypothetical protein
VYWGKTSQVAQTVNLIRSSVIEGRECFISTRVTLPGLKDKDKKDKQKLESAMQCRDSGIAHFFVLSLQPVKKNDSENKFFINIVFHPGFSHNQ